MTESDDELEPRRHTFLQEEARMLSPLYNAEHLGNHWRTEAACFDLTEEGLASPEDWFAPEQTHEAADAAQTCFSCPVRETCLEWASLTKQKHGIWGGLPESVRIPKGSKRDKIKPHDHEVLVQLSDPYKTDNPRSRFHPSKLETWDGSEDE